MKIFLDAGHGNLTDGRIDPGAVGNGLRESDVVWHIAQLVGAKLGRYGVEIMHSRPNIDTPLGPNPDASLTVRTNMANNWGADYFVSIHANSNEGTPGTGTEVFTFPGNTFTPPLAAKVRRAISAKLGLADRNRGAANFAVLRQTRMAAILIETAFINNPRDAALLRDRQADFADAIVAALVEFIGIEIPAEEIVMDVPNSWAKAAWDWAVAEGITDGTNPQGECTREQVITFLHRAIIGEGRLR